ncbi:MAG: Do family serine endopeptidase [Alphaproteobacteria bacterium]|jgi:serine protease Do|nr:Do family serine endopeptidase [Alphaproteobacteria bacterium]
MINRFGISLKALAAGVAGAGAMAAFTFGPQIVLPADARPIKIETPNNAPVSFADLIERVSPAVVSVNVVSEREVGSLADMERFMERFRDMPGFEDFMDRRFGEPNEDGEREPRTEEARALGSGFFISADGYIVTNNHVVDSATEIQVVLEDGRELDARLVGADPQTDLAVIKVDNGGKDFEYVEFGESEGLRRGDWVVALGNPYGLGGTATAGIVSALGRRDQLGRSSTYTDFLQIDAAINRGNSGGPTFDLAGNVIGVNTAIFSPTGGSVGIGFAIPAELAEDITETLIEDGRVSRGWLGVVIQDLTEDMAEAQGLDAEGGAIVADVNADGPAADAGMERGDVILSVNGTTVEDATALTREVGALLAGSTNRFTILRDGRQRTLKVKVGERPEDPYSEPGASESSDAPAEDAEGPLGARVAPLDEATRESLGLDAGEPGVVITELSDDSPLRDSGMRPGMAILEVNGESVSSAVEIRSAIETARERDRSNVLLAVRAGEVTTFMTVAIDGQE